MFKSTGKGSTRRGAGQKTGTRPKGPAGSLGYLPGPWSRSLRGFAPPMAQSELSAIATFAFGRG